MVAKLDGFAENHALAVLIFLEFCVIGWMGKRRGTRGGVEA
jgi:hypothetical protein